MKFFLGGLFLLFSVCIHAQSYEVGAWAGGINYFGDVNTNSNPFSTRPSGGVLGKYNFDSRLAASLTASYGRMFSTDNDLANTDFTNNRNEAVRTKTLDISAMAEFNFFPFNSTEMFENPEVYTPYLAAGIGFSNITPEIFFRDEGWVDVGGIRTEDEKDFSAQQISVPLAAGIKYQLNQDFIIAGEWSSHLLFTDYYDDISTVYNQLSIDNNIGTLTTVGRQRGDRFKNDTYNLVGVKVTYVIPRYNCPGE